MWLAVLLQAVVWAVPNLFGDSEFGWREGSAARQGLLRPVDLGRWAGSWLLVWAVANPTGRCAFWWMEGPVVWATSLWVSIGVHLLGRVRVGDGWSPGVGVVDVVGFLGCEGGSSGWVGAALSVEEAGQVWPADVAAVRAPCR